MMRAFIAFIVLLILIGAAQAQGPGPVPDPWSVSGLKLWPTAQGCIVMPPTLPCPGGNTISANGVFVGPSSAGGASFSIMQGTTPTSPGNGNIWTTSIGLFARINGQTVGPMIGGNSAFTQNLPIIGGTPTVPLAQGTRSGNTTEFATVSGAVVAGDCPVFDSHGNLIDSGSTACTSATGSLAVYQTFTSIGGASSITLTNLPIATSVSLLQIAFDGVLQAPPPTGPWTYNSSTGVVTFSPAVPSTVQQITAWWLAPSIFSGVGGLTIGPTTLTGVLTMNAGSGISLTAGSQAFTIANTGLLGLTTGGTTQTGTVSLLTSGGVTATASGQNLTLGTINQIRSPIKSVSVNTSSASATGTTLHFASVPTAVLVGNTVADATTPSAIPAGTVVSSINRSAGTVTVSAGVTSVGNGDSISFFGLTLFVATTGSDANPCSFSSPCLTRAATWNALASSYDLSSCQGVTVKLADGTYTDTFGPTNSIGTQCSPQQVVYTGDCTTPRNVLVQPSTANAFLASVNVGYTFECMYLDQTPQVQAGTGADIVVAALGAKLYVGKNMVFGCNYGPYNVFTLFANAYVEFDYGWTIDTSLCDQTALTTFAMGATSFVVSGLTGTIQPSFGIAAAGIPPDAYVSSIVGTTINFACRITSPCAATTNELSPITVEFFGGGQTFIDAALGSTGYFSTNGNPAVSLLSTFTTYAHYGFGFFNVADNSTVNLQAITFVGASVSRGNCGQVRSMGVMDTNFQGFPYVPCLGFIGGTPLTVVSVSLTTGSNTIAVPIASVVAPIVIGQAVNGFEAPSATFRAIGRRRGRVGRYGY